jgi:hypothetical protein
MHEVLATEAETIDNDEEQLALLGDKHIANLQRRILSTAAILTGIPFTFQRSSTFPFYYSVHIVGARKTSRGSKIPYTQTIGIDFFAGLIRQHKT